MITIATYSNESEAYIAKGLLESEGVCSELEQQMETSNPIMLQVYANDSDRARAILEG